MKQLKALLIGINKYTNYPLKGCNNDVQNIETYIEEHLKHKFEEDKVSIVKLLDEAATKQSIIQEILQLKNSTNDTAILIYFSGHGTQEETGGLFKEDYNGLIECLVCYEDSTTNNLLADKEIRYLLSQFTNNPHLVTIFDCCHSGTMTKAPASDKQELTRSIYGGNPPRVYAEFYFSDTIEKNKLVDKFSYEAFGAIKNHIHIGACLATEQSTEKPLPSPFDTSKYEQQGVLTNYLINFLIATNSNVNYEELSRWSNISFNNTTTSKQTPNIKKLGKGHLDKLSGWLGVADLSKRDFLSLKVYPHKGDWYIDKGKLWGLEKGMTVAILEDEVEILETTIEYVALNNALIKLSAFSQALDANKVKGYKAQLKEAKTTHNQLKVYINDIDQADAIVVETATRFLENIENLYLSEKEEADVYLTFFNQTIYYNFGQEDYQFRPLAAQLDLLQENVDIGEFLAYQTPYLQKWFYCKTLKNPNNSYNPPSIKLEIRESGKEWKEVLNNDFLDFYPTKLGDGFSIDYQLRITRTKKGNSPIFVAAYILWADMMIDVAPLDVQELTEYGEVVELYSAHDGIGHFTLDKDKEFYNWEKEPITIKFIVSEQHFSISGLKQGSLARPAMIEILGGGGGGARAVIARKRQTWQTYQLNLTIINPTYNQITGVLEAHLQEVADNDLLSGFIQQLYVHEQSFGYTFNPILKQNNSHSSQKATDSKIIKFLNRTFNAYRKRRFKKRVKDDSLSVVLAEGDSWFLLPNPFIKDTISYISEKFNVRSLADAGDELTDYYNNGQLLAEVAKLKPKIILLSGGGNDVIGPPIEALLHKNSTSKLVGKHYIKTNTFDLKLKELQASYEYFIENILNIMSREPFKVKILIHGYDYIRSNPDHKTIQKGWANKYMINAGVIKPSDRKEIISYLIDAFNQMLSTIAQKYDGHVLYINNRGQLADHQWSDEIHPNSEGYKIVADNFLKAM